MQWFLKCLKKYAVFTGRARRKEYWMFILFSMLSGAVIGFVIAIVLLISGASEATMDSVSDSVASLYQLFLLVPGLAVGVRRMHDTDRSGWFILVPFYNLYLACCDGTVGDNRFGLDPKDRGQSMGFQESESTYRDQV